MIVARAPARVSFGGGGTDLPMYYEQYGGFVVSMAINRYCYVTIRQPGDGMVHLDASNYRRSIVAAPRDLPVDDALFRFPIAVINAFSESLSWRRGIDVTIDSEIPVSAGLGSSSSLIVALIQAVSAYAGVCLDADDVADLACDIEINHLGRCIGKQDQYASARGGLNAIGFRSDAVNVRPLALAPYQLDRLVDRLLLFGTGHTRDAADVLRQQSRATTTRQPSVISGLHELKMIATEMDDALELGDIDRFGALLDAAWCAKRRLSTKVSSLEIDDWYEAAQAAGALGGKLCGAGGGGHFLFLCEDGRQDDLRAVMTGSNGLRELEFDVDMEGVRLLSGAEDTSGVLETSAVSN